MTATISLASRICLVKAARSMAKVHPQTGTAAGPRPAFSRSLLPALAYPPPIPATRIPRQPSEQIAVGWVRESVQMGCKEKSGNRVGPHPSVDVWGKYIGVGETRQAGQEPTRGSADLSELEEE